MLSKAKDKEVTPIVTIDTQNSFDFMQHLGALYICLHNYRKLTVRYLFNYFFNIFKMDSIEYVESLENSSHSKLGIRYGVSDVDTDPETILHALGNSDPMMLHLTIANDPTLYKLSVIDLHYIIFRNEALDDYDPTVENDYYTDTKESLRIIANKYFSHLPLRNPSSKTDHSPIVFN
jgi:hypothetical protein